MPQIAIELAFLSSVPFSDQISSTLGGLGAGQSAAKLVLTMLSCNRSATGMVGRSCMKSLAPHNKP
jgi:hypothetical protein